MDVEILSELGLTNAEIKIYLALLDLGQTTAGPIIKRTKLHNSVVHSTLPKLAEKGFISFIKVGGIKNYTASDPRNVLKFIEEKKRKFEEILPELLNKQKQRVPQEAEIFQGIKGLKVMHNQLIADSEKGDEYLFFVFDTKNPEDYEKVYHFYRGDYLKRRINKGLKMKGLAPERLRKTILKSKWAEGNVKFANFPIPTNISICNNKIVFTPWEDGDTSFLIQSRQLADSFRSYFYSIWDNLEK